MPDKQAVNLVNYPQLGVVGVVTDPRLLLPAQFPTLS